LELAYLETVLSLAKAVDARDSYTSDHSQRLAVWAESVAVELGCDESEIQDILWAALLHDIGKIGVPDDILRKPGPLTEAEWSIMKQHPIIGAEIIDPVRSLSEVAPLIRAHQEKYDGSGYPDGLVGEAIPLGARILAVVDAYSAITDDRVYRQARSHAEAVEELRRCAGTQFDPQVVEVFLALLAREQEGAPVEDELASERAIKAHKTGTLTLKEGIYPDQT
jgi:putative nucleotidyltransferase with HDIG domain